MSRKPEETCLIVMKFECSVGANEMKILTNHINLF
jgi:hypothetical protein